ncbi:MAG: molybdopterin-synthase adenylyltransferase MoeB [Thermoplasmata archaeon]|nr:molybdopterin-synthase adenylyltransferase MoeB [Thermoplasmata archaeon]
MSAHAGDTRGPPRVGSPASAALSDEERSRYARHLVLPQVGVPGQLALKRSKVLIVGMGGLGAPAALYLAAAGVGTIGLADFDEVAASNLQRQVLYGTSDLGVAKLTAASRRLHDLNPSIRFVPQDGELSEANALDVLRGYDVVVDGTDNFPARYLVNDACAALGIPDVFGSIFRFEGQASVFDARTGPCYRCLFPEPPPADAVPSCEAGGVLGALPGLIGLIQATETLKILLGLGSTLVGRLLLYDALEMRFRELQVRKDPECARCGSPERLRAPLTRTGEACELPGSRVPEVAPPTLQRELTGPTPPLLVDVREPGEFAYNRIPGALLVPMGEIDRRLAEISRAPDVVVYCHHGIRSATAARHLLDLGLPKVRSLKGGIDAWSAEVDASVPTY